VGHDRDGELADNEETTADGEVFADPETTVDEQPFGARTDAEIAALVAQHIDILPQLARRMRRDVGGAVDVDDLTAIGRATLFDAARAHDPSKSPFPAYATKRVRWAMLDHVRRETHGRAHAARARAIAALTHVDESPLATEAAEPTEESNREHLRELFAAEAAALFIGLTTAEDQAGGAAPDPEEALVRERAKAALRGALAGLSERDRSILDRHYFKGEAFDAIAETIGVSKSWLSRIHSRLLATLGTALADH